MSTTETEETGNRLIAQRAACRHILPSDDTQPPFRQIGETTHGDAHAPPAGDGTVLSVYTRHQPERLCVAPNECGVPTPKPPFCRAALLYGPQSQPAALPVLAAPSSLIRAESGTEGPPKPTCQVLARSQDKLLTGLETFSWFPP